MIYLLAIITILVSVIEAYYDANTKNPEHLISAIVRTASIFVVCWYNFGFVNAIFVSIALMSLYSAVFDPLYNVFSGKKWYYIGKTAWTDKVARKLNADGYGWVALKLLISIASLTILRYV